MKRRAGDTLVEVTLAIAIFSMVAVAVSAVVNGSTSGAQIALETTITREEIDAQAEALRFIHSSYIAGGQANEEGEDRYVNLWREIVKRAKNRGESFDFVPSTCAELYSGTNLNDQGAFIVNTRNLSFLGLDRSLPFDEVMKQIIITPDTTDSGIFTVAATYPRVLYLESTQEGNYIDDTILGQSAGFTVDRVEGIYVIPIRDEDTTNVVDSTGIERKAAYYDFYIRSCWFNTGADRPSTISTVIRLYDPDVIDYGI